MQFINIFFYTAIAKTPCKHLLPKGTVSMADISHHYCYSFPCLLLLNSLIYKGCGRRDGANKRVKNLYVQYLDYTTMKTYNSSLLHFLYFNILIILKTATFLFCFWLYQESSTPLSYKECLPYYICPGKDMLPHCLWKAVLVAISAVENKIICTQISS